jgi:hypothetical protein
VLGREWSALARFYLNSTPYFVADDPGPGVETKVQDVYDFLNDESLADIDVNVEAMEQVAVETESASKRLEMDTDSDLEVVIKLLGEEDFIMNIASGTIHQLI